MPKPTTARRASTLSLIASLLAFVALALGLWDVYVERDGGENLLSQIILLALFAVLFLAYYLRGRRAR